MTSPADRQNPVLVVLDTSVVIRFKTAIPVAEQWSFFVRLTELVAAGVVGWPRHVRREITRARHPDAPGAWLAGQRGQPFPEPTYDSVAEALGAAQLVDVDADDEDVADPWVVAMALELRDTRVGVRVVVASEDVVDRMPQKESIATACERLDLELWRCAELVAWVGEPGDG